MIDPYGQKNSFENISDGLNAFSKTINNSLKYIITDEINHFSKTITLKLVPIVESA
jgi:hypothetical protein